MKEKFEQAVIKLIEDRRRAFAAATLFALIAVVFSIWSVMRADYYQRVVEAALAKKTENTPQTFKALESLILVDAESGPDGNQIAFTEHVKAATLFHEFGRIVSEVHEVLKKNQQTPHKDLIIAEPEITNGEVRRQEDAIITELNDPADDTGFLFLPARLLHIPAPIFQEMRNRKKPIEPAALIQRAGNHDQCSTGENPFCDDILISRRLTRILKEATKTPVTRESIAGVDVTPQQVYVITGNGLNRIVSRDGNDSSVYRNQFRAATVFPARPYYIGAFKQIEPKELLAEGEGVPQGAIGGYFYVSEPYLDIGGNGIVITLARPYRYSGHSDGAICFDLKLAPPGLLKDKLDKFIRKLDGKTAGLQCKMSATTPADCGTHSGDEALAKAVQPDLQDSLNKARKLSDVSEVIGNFSFLRRDEAEGPVTADAGLSRWVYTLVKRVIVHPNRELRFAIPAGPPSVTNTKEQQIQLSFLAASLNVGKYLQTTAIMGAGALFCFGISLATLVISWAAETRFSQEEKEKRTALENVHAVEMRLAQEEREKREALENALQNVAAVMQSADTPYVRLDDEDRIVDCNPALAVLFGFPPTREAIDGNIRHTRFEDWMADPHSKTIYGRVQMLRKSDRRVDPYHINFRVINGGAVQKRVVSSVVPATQATAGSLPETFGILV